MAAVLLACGLNSFDHILHIRNRIDGFQINGRIFIRKNPEHLIGKGLANPGHAFEIQDNFRKSIKA